jgi:hypothetical protein
LHSLHCYHPTRKTLSLLPSNTQKAPQIDGMATVNWMVVLASNSFMPQRNHRHNMKRIDFSDVKGKVGSSSEIGNTPRARVGRPGSVLSSLYQCHPYKIQVVFVIVTCRHDANCYKGENTT